jgi:hypothetical protein
MVAVKYEQHIGRRVPGQDNGGNFNISASRTVSDSLDATLNRWIQVMTTYDDLSGFAITRGPDISETDQWRYWRAGLEDGSRIVVNISLKSSDKSVISVQHERLSSLEAADHWRLFWKTVLKEI